MSNWSMRASWSTGPSRRHPILTAYFVFRRQRPPTSMAKRNYLVEGLPDAGLPGGPVHHDDSMWDKQKAVSELESPEPEVLFVCGSSRNRDRFLPYFTKIFNLRIDDDTMRRRLQERTDDDWPLGQEGVELMLTLNRSDEKPAGATYVDATQPLHQVVDELLRLANCRT